MKFRGQDIAVQELTKDSFADIDIALFSAGGGISKEFAPITSLENAVYDYVRKYLVPDKRLDPAAD